MLRHEKRWIVAGGYAIDADAVLYINTAARWHDAYIGESLPTEWGKAPTHELVERTGVEVVWSWMRDDQKPLRFPDGTPEAEDLRAFVKAQKLRPDG